MDNGPFLHWFVWTMATLIWCAIAYRQMRITRPLTAFLVGVAAILTGFGKELTDVTFDWKDIIADSTGTVLGIILFFMLIRAKRKRR